MKISGRITDSRGVVHSVPSYKPGGLLKDTKVKRQTEKSDVLKRIEIRQREIAGEKFPDNVKPFAHSNR